MKTNFIFNTILYLTVIILYFYEPILGALSQIGLGIFQFAYALTLLNNNETTNHKVRTAFKAYWIVVIVWVITVTATLIASLVKHNNFFLILIYVIPMIIGFYFLIVNYLFIKNIKS